MLPFMPCNVLFTPGILPGDVIKSIDGQVLQPESYEQVQAVVKNNIRSFPEKTLEFVLVRGNTEIRTPVTLDVGLSGQGVVGLALVQNPLPDLTLPSSPL